MTAWRELMHVRSLHVLQMAALAVALGWAGGDALAQEAAVPLGAPGATINIPGDRLPPPASPFGGEINLNADQSTPWWPPRVVPPKRAPNVLLIMTDDSGFGVPSTF